MATEINLNFIGTGVKLEHAVEIDEIFSGPNPNRPHRFPENAAIQGWLSNPDLPGHYNHQERKIRHDEGRYWTTDERMNYQGEIVGYRHRYRFSDPNTAFQFKLQFGRDLIPLA